MSVDFTWIKNFNPKNRLLVGNFYPTYLDNI